MGVLRVWPVRAAVETRTRGALPCVGAFVGAPLGQKEAALTSVSKNVHRTHRRETKVLLGRPQKARDAGASAGDTVGVRQAGEAPPGSGSKRGRRR